QTKTGTITLVKNTFGGDSTFTFNTTGPASNGLPSTPITLATSAGSKNQIFSNLAPATYTIAEVIPPGWQLDSASCTLGGSVSLVTATINLPAGGNVTCTFNDSTVPGNLTINKTAIGGNGTFYVTINGPSFGPFVV